MKNSNKLVKILALMAPILLLVAISVPYAFLNQAVLVDWLGCGCPVIDEHGHAHERAFNANDFTRIFWIVMGAGSILLSTVLAKKHLSKSRFYYVYYAIMVALTVLLCGTFMVLMYWD